MTKARISVAEAAMGKQETAVSNLCNDLGIARTTLYRYAEPDRQLREFGMRVLKCK